MLLDGFRKYLKRRGKKDNVIQRNIRTIEDFQSFLKNENKSTFSKISVEDIRYYMDNIEKAGGSAKGFLYVLMNYFHYTKDQKLFSYTAQLREERTSKTRKIFSLKNFLGIDQKIIEKLGSIGIKNVDQMIEHGRSREQRKQLATHLKIPEKKILELVTLSDLTRLGYVKRKLSRLYYDAGIRSPHQIAEFEPETLYEFFKVYVKDSGWSGMVPNLKDLENNIKSARELTEIVEY